LRKGVNKTEGDFYPIDVFFMLSPAERIVETAIRLKRDDLARRLASIMSRCSEKGFEPVSLNLTLREDFVYLVCFLKANKASSDLNELFSTLKEEGEIDDYKIRRSPVKDKIFNNLCYPITVDSGRQRMILDDRNGLSFFIKEIHEKYGTGGEAFLYFLGKTRGEISGRIFRSKKITREFLEEDLRSLQAAGWGIAELLDADLDKKFIRVRIYDLYESAAFEGRSSKPRCHFIRGYLEGLFSEFLGVELESNEVKCIAMGDPYCEFVFKKAEST